MRITRVAWRVMRVARREASQSDRRQQLARAHLHDGTRARGVEQLGAERHGEDLIGSQARIHLPTATAYPVRAIDDVVEVATRRIPETLDETCRRLGRRGGVASCRAAIVHTPRPLCHATQGEVPERIDLHCLTGPWSHDPVAYLGVHPRELHPRFAGK